MASKNLSRESQLSITAAPFLYKSSFTKVLPWRIKQLVSHRRSRTFGDGEISIAEGERRLDGKLSRKLPERRSWVDSKASIDNPFLENSSENRQKKNIACSSSFSLCDSLSPSPLPKILYLQPNEDLSGDALSWSLIFSAAEESKAPPSKSTFNLLEALHLEPSNDDEQTPTPTIKDSRGSCDETSLQVYEGIERLIRETDEAFKGISVMAPDSLEVGEASSDAKKEPKMAEVERHVLKKKQRKIPATRSNSVSKAKRTKSTKKRARLLNHTSAIPLTSVSPSQNQRWTQLADMTDNISEIFSGRRFGKMEVNEMIDTTRIGRTPYSERKQSTDTMISHAIDEVPETPNDPFFLESLPSRLDLASKIFTPPDPTPAAQTSTIEPPSIPLKSVLRSSRRDSAIYVGNGISILTHPGNTDISMPLVASLRQRSRSYPNQPSLPTIQEISPSSPDSKAHLKNPMSTRTLQSSSSKSLTSPGTQISQENNHILLNSTPFTLTAPHFQHGSIRLPRGQKRNLKSTNSSTSTLEHVEVENINREGGGDSGLDWTAFQMAISGSTDDYHMDGVELEDEIEGSLEEIEDIMKWWNEFGFEGMGRLVDSTSTTHKRKKSKLTSEDVGISYELDANPINEVGDNSEETAMRKTETGGSLPPSPVDDLAPLETSMKKYQLDELVPMGSNLSHDLDDYLNWQKTICTEE